MLKYAETQGVTYRNSSEFSRNLLMLDEMANLKGKIVIGSDWRLACQYGRGEPKSKILEKKDKLSPVFFAMNYESRWVGATDNALVDIKKLLCTRTLTNPEFKSDGKSEYVMGVDVARSDDSSNNQSSVAVLKIKRSKNGRIMEIQLVNLFNISNVFSFAQQAIEVKKLYKLFTPSAVLIDSNGLGVGLVDELLRENLDPDTGESLGCWDTMNTDKVPEVKNSPRVVYDLKPQSANSDIITVFIDMVESGKLRLLEKRQNIEYDVNDDSDYVRNVLPFINTEFLIQEVSNLKIKHLSSGKLSVESVVKKANKDRYSALAYALWYIKTFEDNITIEEVDALDLLMQYTVL